MKKYLIAAAVLLAVVFALAGGYRAHLVRALKEPLLVQLVDRSSAEFRNVRIVGDWTLRGTTMCGELNSRNRFGGYEGFQKFLTQGGGFVVGGDDQLVEAMCGEASGPSPWWHLKG